MNNSAPQIGEGRYTELDDASWVLQSADRERLNDRLSWLPDGERSRILEEAWFEGPGVYDRIDEERSDEVTQIWPPKIEGRVQVILEALKLEGIRAKTNRLAQECTAEVLAIASELRDVVRRHTRAFIIAAGLATGISSTWFALHSDIIPEVHAAQRVSGERNCQIP